MEQNRILLTSAQVYNATVALSTKKMGMRSNGAQHPQNDDGGTVHRVGRLKRPSCTVKNLVCRFFFRFRWKKGCFGVNFFPSKVTLLTFRLPQHGSAARHFFCQGQDFFKVYCMSGNRMSLITHTL
jgi:hypothetical protein